MKKKGVTLIGMPASGKSTVALALSSVINYGFIDIDQWMEDQEAMPVGMIIKTKGKQYALDLESSYVNDRDHYESIVSPPGSIIYTNTYDRLNAQTHIIWLKNSVETIRARLAADTKNEREVIGLDDHGLETLFAERLPLYKAWASHVIEADEKSVDEIVGEIIIYLNNA